MSLCFWSHAFFDAASKQRVDFNNIAWPDLLNALSVWSDARMQHKLLMLFAQGTMYSVKDLHQPSSGCGKSTCESLPRCEQLYHPLEKCTEMTLQLRARFRPLGLCKENQSSVPFHTIWPCPRWRHLYDIAKTRSTLSTLLHIDLPAYVGHFLSCRCCVDCQPSAGACSRFNLCRPG